MLKNELALKDGEFLVKLAREAIATFLTTHRKMKPPSETSEKLLEKSGVFTTLDSVKNGTELRGCIGYPYPTLPLAEAVIDSAIEAATGDPRFPPVSLSELEREIVIEVSVLRKPELIKVKNPQEYPKHVMIGKDGLIVEGGYSKGLLLPQVPIEWNWDQEEFLSNCCLKAGLPPDSWLLKETKIYKFQAIIFREKSPKGQVELRALPVTG